MHSLPPAVNARLLSRPVLSRGFTLLEILVVITLIGILAGMATLALGGNERRELQHEAKRLQQLLLLATDEAVFNHQNLGFSLDDNSYRFFTFDEEKDRWLALEQKPWQTYQLPPFAQLSLQLEGEAGNLIVLNKSDSIDEQSTNQPTVMLLASGELTPFNLDFTLQEESQPIARIYSDGFNAPTLTLGGAIDANE